MIESIPNDRSTFRSFSSKLSSRLRFFNEFLQREWREEIPAGRIWKNRGERKELVGERNGEDGLNY